jgi:hypothetical protein
MLDAQVIQRGLAAQPVGQCPAACDSKIVQEVLECLGLLAAEPADLLFSARCCEGFYGHACTL